MECGVYAIVNIKTNHRYIGGSVNLKSRWRHHKWELANGVHQNKRLQEHYCEHGAHNFKYCVLEKCEPGELVARERYWIAELDSMSSSSGYNLESGGNNGKIVSQEAKVKKLGAGNPMFGKKWNENQRTNIPLKNRANSKLLTEVDITAIKLKRLEGMFLKDIAELYGVDLSTIGKITTGVNWYWVAPELTQQLKDLKAIRPAEAIKLFKMGTTRKKNI